MTPVNRRRFLAATSSSVFALASGCLDTPGAGSGGHSVDDAVTAWPSFRGGRHNTGYARGVAPTGSVPTVEWTYEADGPFWGSPIVVEDTVFIGGTDGSLYALEIGSGELAWSSPTDGRIEATPAYADGTVFVGSYDQHVYAFEGASGDRLWRRDLGGLIRGSPTVTESAVYVGAGCYNLACAWYAEGTDAPRNGWIYALDADSGETNWRYEVGAEVVSTPAIGGNTVYVGASDGMLYALDAPTGEVMWTYEADDMIWSSPALSFGTVYVADWAGKVHAVEAASGESEWTADTFGDYVSGSVAVDEEAVYVGHTPLNTLDDPTTYYGAVFRFDRSTGEEEWRFETDALEVGSSPAVTDGHLYVGTHSQTDGDGVGVYGLTTDGEEEWFLEVGARGVGSSPALIDGTLYFGGTDGLVYAVS